MKIRQFLITALLLIFTIVAFHWYNFDLWVQDFFYEEDLRQWVLDRNSEIPKFVFYDGIKLGYIVFVIALATTLLFFKKTALLQPYVKGLIIVLLSCLIVPLLIGSLKAITNIPCPKDIANYNGAYPYVSFLDAYPDNFLQIKNQRCFPAAHASGGFALLSLLFLFKTRKIRVITLSSVMGLSWSIGLYKMLIGDHFLSHTLVSMLLAWMIILLIAGAINSGKSVTKVP